MAGTLSGPADGGKTALGEIFVKSGLQSGAQCV